jgi:hypothetical protein
MFLAGIQEFKERMPVSAGVARVAEDRIPRQIKTGGSG